ncbi:MAG: diguanylate cyclase [Polyangiaceae bacterium]
MDPLVQASLFLRRSLRRGHGLVVTGALAAFVALGGAEAPLGPLPVIAAGTFGWLFVSRLSKKLRLSGEAPTLLDFELGASLAVGVYAALLRVEGNLNGELSPAIYVLVALVAAFARPLAGILVLAWVVVLEAILRRVRFHETSFDALVTHASFVVAFGVLNLASLRAEIVRTRMTARARIEAELVRLREDARSYRLLGAGDENGQDERSEERLARSSVEEIHQSVHYALELLRRSLNLHTAVLLWLNDAATHLRISELSTSSEDVNDAPFVAGDGVLGVVALQKERVSLKGLTPSFKIPYYTGECPVQVLAAIPVAEEGALRGILAIDRVENVPFSPHEEEIAAHTARFCLRAIQNERVFVQLERAKVEQGKLYRAAQSLGAALSEREVLDAGVRAAREIASFDFAAVTTYDDTTKRHKVCAVTSSNGELDDVEGAEFPHNQGLVSMVVANRYPLPYKGDFGAAHQSVLARNFPFPRVPSLLVLPLLIRDRVLGTLILGATRRHAFGDSVRPTLEVLASHLAVSLSNARMVQKLETLATTDGLTGLFNKRAMLDVAKQKIVAASRFGRELSVLVTDIDFFKKVNDTYGHDVGDLVIRGLGDILARQKRETDVVARFGGEEFVVLCEQTDEKGALLLAERIREELEKTIFRAATTSFQVTCSIGIATFPVAGGDWDAIFKAADEALYASKHGGRNRTTTWRPAPRKSDFRVKEGDPSRAKVG